MKKKQSIPLPPASAQQYVMGFAEKLSDDPMIQYFCNRLGLVLK